MHEKHRIVRKYKKRKEKNRKLITKKKRANEQRDEVTRCESLSNFYCNFTYQIFTS